MHRRVGKKGGGAPSYAALVTTLAFALTRFVTRRIGSPATPPPSMHQTSTGRLVDVVRIDTLPQTLRGFGYAYEGKPFGYNYVSRFKMRFQSSRKVRVSLIMGFFRRDEAPQQVIGRAPNTVKKDGYLFVLLNIVRVEEDVDPFDVSAELLGVRLELLELSENRHRVCFRSRMIPSSSPVIVYIPS